MLSIHKSKPRHNKALDAEPPIASLLKSMLIGGGPVNAVVIPLNQTMDPPLKSDADNWIAIIDASRDGDAESVRELPKIGTHPDSPDNFSGLTPLHYAIAANNLEIVIQLFDAGADVNHRNNSTGSTPLECAVVAKRKRAL